MWLLLYTHCLFSMEGSVCKLPEIVELKKKYKVRDALLIEKQYASTLNGLSVLLEAVGIALLCTVRLTSTLMRLTVLELWVPRGGECVSIGGWTLLMWIS